MDNRGSHFIFRCTGQISCKSKSRYRIQQIFAPIAKFIRNETSIVHELQHVQGVEIDIGGYYHPEEEKISQVMRPSTIFNDIIDALTNRN